MRVLALDTTTRAGSVALVEDGETLIERSGDVNRTYAERLPGDILALLAEAGLTSSDVNVFAIASGPGSFTGLRIGMATIQGLAFVHRRRIVGVSALEALAHAGSAGCPEGTIVASWMDAYRRDVFSALYRLGGGAVFSRARLIELDPPSVADPAATLRRWTDELHLSPAIFAGDGAVTYAQAIDGRGQIVAPPPLAGAIGRIAFERAQAGLTVDPAGVQPLYVRRPDAEVARDRQARDHRSPEPRNTRNGASAIEDTE
jgi:tRNA threonylcarbamoyladenosine biosynthesis protein TsaB